MKIRKLPNGCLELSESWPLVRWACVALAVLLPPLLLYGVWVESSPDSQPLLDGGVASIAAALIAAVLQDWHFLFDPQQRTLTWRCRNWFRDRYGVMRVQSPTDSLFCDMGRFFPCFRRRIFRKIFYYQSQ